MGIPSTHNLELAPTGTPGRLKPGALWEKFLSLDSWLSVRAQSPSPLSLILISWFLWQSSRELPVHGSRCCPQLLTGLVLCQVGAQDT